MFIHRSILTKWCEWITKHLGNDNSFTWNENGAIFTDWEGHFQLQASIIIEGGKTWQHLFDSIVNHMKELRLKETIDESESLLELRDRYTNETLDLFYMKNELNKSGNKEDSD